MAIMTKENIEKAIRKYLENHLDLIPQLKRDGLFNVKINQISMAEPFVFTGRGEYKFTGEGEGCVLTEDGGKSIRRFRILPSLAMISEGEKEPVVENIKEPVLIEYL